MKTRLSKQRIVANMDVESETLIGEEAWTRMCVVVRVHYAIVA